MLQYMNVHPQVKYPEPEDLYKDTRVREHLDRAAAFVASGALGSFGPTSPMAGGGSAAEGGEVGQSDAPTLLESS